MQFGWTFGFQCLFGFDFLKKYDKIVSPLIHLETPSYPIIPSSICKYEFDAWDFVPTLVWISFSVKDGWLFEVASEGNQTVCVEK